MADSRSGSDFDKREGTIGEGVKSTVRDASERFGSGSARAFTADENTDPADVINASLKTAGEVYERASSWIERNVGGRGAGILAAVAVAGVLGYMVGRGKLGGGDISTDFDAY